MAMEIIQAYREHVPALRFIGKRYTNGDLGTAWVRGSLESGELFGDAHGKVCEKLAERGLGEFRSDIAGPGSDTYCFAERYQCPRFTEKDAEGRVILDYINYIF